MEGNYKKWINRINAKQDILTEDNLGQLMDLELSTKSTPTSGDTVLGRDSLTGKAVEIPTSSFGGSGGGSGLALGETSSTAFRGDWGKTAYDHSQTTDSNPHGTTATDVDALKRDGSNANSNIDIGEFQLKAGQIELDQTPTQPFGVGMIRWNDTDGTAEIRLKGNNVTLQLGQELVKRVVNKSGANLLESQYKVVKIVGATGQRLSIDLAQANNELNSATTLGMVTENINNNQEGFITYNGEVNGINTTGSLQGETWEDGDVLYLSPSVAGGVTKVKPIAPNHVVVVGYVEYAHVTQGKIFIKIDNGYELNELHNVLISGTPSNNQVLVYNSSINVWENKGITQSLGYTPLPTTAGTATGTTLSFITDSVYGTIASPITGNITADVTGGQLGVTNIIIHNSGTAPTFGSQFKKLSGSGNYVTGVVNYIYCTYISATEIIYSINQRA